MRGRNLIIGSAGLGILVVGAITTAVVSGVGPAADLVAAPVPSSGQASAALGAVGRMAGADRGVQAQQPGAAQQARISGQIASLTSEPRAFTVLLENGATQNLRVSPATVLKAGPDRPYRFELLKTGDWVIVQALTLDHPRGRLFLSGLMPGMVGVTEPPEAGAQPLGAGRARTRQLGQQSTAADLTAEDPGAMVARMVTVRPAGEARAAPGRGDGQRKKGLNDGA